MISTTIVSMLLPPLRYFLPPPRYSIPTPRYLILYSIYQHQLPSNNYCTNVTNINDTKTSPLPILHGRPTISVGSLLLHYLLILFLILSLATWRDWIDRRETDTECTQPPACRLNDLSRQYYFRPFSARRSPMTIPTWDWPVYHRSNLSRHDYRVRVIQILCLF